MDVGMLAGNLATGLPSPDGEVIRFEHVLRSTQRLALETSQTYVYRNYRHQVPNLRSSHGDLTGGVTRVEKRRRKPSVQSMLVQFLNWIGSN